MNLTEDEKAYLYLDRLIYRLASVVNWHRVAIDMQRTNNKWRKRK